MQKLTIAETIQMVHDFHEAFGITNLKAPSVDVDPKTIKLRFDLMKEENMLFIDISYSF